MTTLKKTESINLQFIKSVNEKQTKLRSYQEEQSAWLSDGDQEDLVQNWKRREGGITQIPFIAKQFFFSFFVTINSP